jgi:multidrug resistance efflux pump
MLKSSRIIQFITRQPKWRLMVAALVVAGLGYAALGRKSVSSTGTTFVARRGPMQISVLEGGSAEALESQEIRSQVKGYQGTKILSIVEEGYLVTEDDIKNGKILVELDNSDLKERITTEEIQFQSTLSGLIEAQQAYDIQLNQNRSDLKAAEQKAKFARMAVDMFLGKQVGEEVCSKLGLHESPFNNEVDLDELEAAALSVSNKSGDSWGKAAAGSMGGPNGTPNPGGNPGPNGAVPQGRDGAQAQGPRGGQTGAPPVADARPRRRSQTGEAGDVKGDEKQVRLQAGQPGTPKADTAPVLVLATNPPAVAGPVSQKIAIGDSTNAPTVDFSKYAKSELLGDGSAQQDLRKMENDFLVATQALSVARIHLEGTQKLLAKDFVTKNDLDNELLTIKRNEVTVAAASTSLDLYIRYQFVKTAEETVSAYDEALRSLERARKEAISKLAQARARLKSAEGRYRIEADQRAELQEQFSNCVIRAKRPGLVVYGGGDDRRFGGEEQIREGVTVRERQSIITIPDMTRMSVKIKIHESHIKKVTKGLKARITADAFPDKVLEGEVIKVGVLPDSQNRWMNPDLKVYVTSVAVNGTQEWLKPGMSAKVEILVKELPDVIYVPIQAVVPVKGKQVCFIPHTAGTEQRVVEVGEFNDEFVQIKSGLKEGEKVLLRAPEGTETDMTTEEAEQEVAQKALPAKPGAGTTPGPGGASKQPEKAAPIDTGRQAGAPRNPGT